MTEKTITEQDIKNMVNEITDEDYLLCRSYLDNINLVCTLTDNRTLIESLFGFDSDELFEHFDRSTFNVIAPFIRKGNIKKINKLRIKKVEFQCKYACDVPDYGFAFICKLPLESVKFACETAAVNHIAKLMKEG